MLKSECDNLQFLARWSQTEQGRMVAVTIQERIFKLKRIFSGFNLVTLQSNLYAPWLDAFPQPYHWRCSVYPDDKVNVVGDFKALPMDKQTVDLLLLPFTLDCFQDKRSILEEVDRVLKPMGFVVIVSMNPFGLYALAQKLSMLPELDQARFTLLSSWKLNRMMNSYGFFPCFQEDIVFVPPFKNARKLQLYQFVNTIGNMIALPGGFYIYIGRKYESASPDVESPARLFVKNASVLG